MGAAVRLHARLLLLARASVLPDRGSLQSEYCRLVRGLSPRRHRHDRPEGPDGLRGFPLPVFQLFVSPMLNALRSSASKGLRRGAAAQTGLLGFAGIRVPYDCILFAKVCVSLCRDRAGEEEGGGIPALPAAVLQNAVRIRLLCHRRKERAYYVDQISNTLDYVCIPSLLFHRP